MDRVRADIPPDPKTGATRVEVDVLEVIHRVPTQIPDSRCHLIRYHGAYSHRSRAARRAREEAQAGEVERDGALRVGHEYAIQCVEIIAREVTETQQDAGGFTANLDSLPLGERRITSRPPMSSKRSRVHPAYETKYRVTNWPAYVYCTLANIVEGTARERCIAEDGEDFESAIAVMAVSWHDANAYCAWKTKVTGREWRLPTEEEREEAARGVDGRRFPWGDLAHASLCKNRDARNESAQPEPVGAFPTATSVYGMVDAGGSFYDWTSSLFEPHVKASTARVVRGGCWVNSARFARAAARNWNTPEFRNPSIGFRPARSVTT